MIKPYLRWLILASALLLAACATSYPLGMSEDEWNRLNPVQQLDARQKQAAIDQAEAEDIEAALTELDREQEDDTLDSKLKAAGISNGQSSGEQVLARIRSRSSANSNE